MQGVGRGTLICSWHISFMRSGNPIESSAPVPVGSSPYRGPRNSLCTGLREVAPSRNQGLTNVGVGGFRKGWLCNLKALSVFWELRMGV